jgi:hypothetical protein
MDCSAFRHHHVAYVDDTLPQDLLVAAARHAAECPACARHDTAVRRSLLLARNACVGAPLECSADFAVRLEARLQREVASGRPADRTGLPADDWTPGWREVMAETVVDRLPAVSAMTGTLTGTRRARHALAAAAVLAAVSGGAMLRGGDRPLEVRGLGGGVLSAVPYNGPFGVPVAVDDGALGGALAAGFVPSPGLGDYGLTAAGGSSTVSAQGPTEVFYDGAVDAGALVAPAAVGVPVWAAAVLAGEVPAVLWRGGGDSSSEQVRVGH